MKKTNFSLIEMMTVIVVILILITLSIPAINQLRKKARTIICANQLKQLGVLMSTYANDNNGRLPYTNDYGSGASGVGVSSSYKDKRGYGKLYGSWAGHLMPYLNVDLKSWDRGKFFYDASTDDIYKPAQAVVNEDYQNWKLLHDMHMEGGHGALKVFICPEAANTHHANLLDQGKLVPRISGIINRYSGYNVRGLPSSYLSNGQLFGKGAIQSKRFEDIDKNNFLLVEGCEYGSQYLSGMATPVDYRKVFQIWAFYGGSVNHVFGGNNATAQDPTKPPSKVAFTYSHDDTEEVWYSSRGKLSISNVNQYNNLYSPFASAFFNWDHSESKFGSLAAKRYPGENWENFENSITKGKFKIYRYYGVDRKASYYFGEMNVLKGDLSVGKSHISSMYQDAKIIGENTE